MLVEYVIFILISNDKTIKLPVIMVIVDLFLNTDTEFKIKDEQIQNEIFIYIVLDSIQRTIRY